MYAHLLCGNREIFVPPWENRPQGRIGKAGRAVQRYRLSPKGNSGQQFEVLAKNGDSSGREVLNL
jgi:hypothetical protein